MNTRYVRRVKTEGAGGAILTAQEYLKQRGFRRVKNEDALYRRGVGIFRPPQFISVEAEDGEVMLTGYRKHAVVPGVFAMDVHRRSKRLIKKVDTLAALLSQDCPDVKIHSVSKSTVLSLICGACGGLLWIVPPVGAAVSVTGIISGMMGIQRSRAVATVGIALSSFFLMFSTVMCISSLIRGG